MPKIFLDILLPLVLKLGVPLLMAYLKRKFPSFPVDNETLQIFEDYASDLKEAKVSARQAKRRVRARLKEKKLTERITANESF